jgi:uncharacterized membrane protein
MKAHWSQLVDKLRTGFWFVPLLMLALSVVLALLLLYVDRRADPGLHASLSWAYTGGPSGARSLLSTIAGSMITAASVTFSLAAVALSLASQQYGSRVLRNFMRDRVTQVLLGTFVATFVYCVLVVRSIRGSDYSGGFVPAISVTVAILLAVLSLVLLIYFVHHVSASIQASQIIRVVAKEILGSVKKLYPSNTGEPMEDAADLRALAMQGRMSVALAKGGYVQTIDLDSLVRIAAQQNVALELTTKPGEHLIAGADVMQVWGAGSLPEEALDDIRKAFELAQERTPAQDIRYSFQQLTDVIVRALSPGINDPFTAINGIDELAAGVALMASHGRVSEQRKDENNVLRLVAPATDLAEVLEETVGHIALYAAKDHFVMDSLRRVLKVAGRATDPDQENTVARLGKELDRLQRKAETAA